MHLALKRWQFSVTILRKCAPFIFSPHFPTPSSIDRKRTEWENGGGYPPSSISLPSQSFHGACQRGEREECNGAIYSNCCYFKKKRERKENLSFSPLSTHPSSTETMTGQCGCPFSVCCGPPPLPNSSHHLLTRPAI